MRTQPPLRERVWVREGCAGSPRWGGCEEDASPGERERASKDRTRPSVLDYAATLATPATRQPDRVTAPKVPRRRKRDVLGSLRQPKVAVMLALGFSSGLPFLLSGNTLGYWLREEGTTLKAIGFLSWVGLAYS